MKRPECNSLAFETVLDQQGGIPLPRGIREKLVSAGFRRVHVSVTDRRVSTELEQRGVTEDEVERIARLQLEDREHVLQFLTSEGCLKGSRFGRPGSRAEGRR